MMGILKRIADLCRNGKSKKAAEEMKNCGEREENTMKDTEQSIKKTTETKERAQIEIEIVLPKKTGRQLARMLYRAPGNNYRKLHKMQMRRFRAKEKAAKNTGKERGNKG